MMEGCRGEGRRGERRPSFNSIRSQGKGPINLIHLLDLCSGLLGLLSTVLPREARRGKMGTTRTMEGDRNTKRERRWAGFSKIRTGKHKKSFNLLPRWEKISEVQGLVDAGVAARARCQIGWRRQPANEICGKISGLSPTV